MAMERWDPFRELTERFFEDRFPWPTRWVARERTLPIDMYETPSEIVVKARIAGVKPEEVDISLEEGLLTIKGHIPSDADLEESKSYAWLHHELGHGDFMRSISLPRMVEADKAEASFDNGVLTLTIPKAEAVKARQIKVKAGK